MSVISLRERLCYRCSERRPADQFYQRPDGKANNICRLCRNQQNYALTAVDPERYKANRYKYYYREDEHGVNNLQKSWLKKRYGLTPEEYVGLFQAQGGACAICHKTFIKKRSVTEINVDHDPVTKQVRGLLCHSCNRGLGCFKDSSDVMRAGADYLEKNR